MFSIIKNWRRKRIVLRARFDEALWRIKVKELSVLQGFDAGELERLKRWVILFLHAKQLQPAAGLALNDSMRLTIAAQACLLILNLDLDYYADWLEVIVYPDAFIKRQQYVDAAGVVHTRRGALAGEAHSFGPVVLSWADAQLSVRSDGINVILHEFAHKLDMRNGEPNGYPPLHSGMSRAQWNKVFAAAYQDFCAREQASVHGEDLPFDPYAAESPAEFFAVLTEVFFETPHSLKRWYPEVYQQLAAFYRQDPSARIPTDAFDAAVQRAGAAQGASALT